MTYTYDLSGFIHDLTGLLPAYELGDGRYQRHRLAGAHPGVGEPDAYGCADATNILYTLARLPADSGERQALVDGIQSFQDPATGIFGNPTHSTYHTTAHCTAALELFDARPGYHLTFLDQLISPGGIETFLDQLDWGNPWRASHDGAGCAAALAITGEATSDWFERYFAWLDAEVDPGTGLWRRGRMLPLGDGPGRFANLAGTFHYHFVYSYFRRHLPSPDRLVDTCLLLLADSPVDIGSKSVGFKDIDWVYCLNRATRQTPHRRKEAVQALEVVCRRVVARLSDTSYVHSPEFDDLHTMFGALCAVAELQQALPGSIRTPRPLRLVLDRRPFI